MTTTPPPIKRPLQVKCLFRTHSKHRKKPAAFRSNSSTLTLLSPVKGYDDMEAQFAWDDKTIRQTFIRKVRQPRRKRTPNPLAALFWQHVPPPAGLRHPPDAAAGHGRHRGALLLLVTPLLKEHVYSLTPVETVIWILLHLQRACEVLHPDPPWPVHGVLVSEITAEMQRHHVFLVLYDVWSPDLIAASCSLPPISRCPAVESWGEPAFQPELHHCASSVDIYSVNISYCHHSLIQTGGSFHGISFCWFSL